MDRTGTIFSLSSGHGRAGVAVIRLSGPGSRASLVELAGVVPPPRQASLRTLRHPATGEVLDKGLVLWMPAPRSFTGEDMAELHVHGGRAVVAGVLEALSLLPDLRPAEAGEFTRRAHREGRMDLIEVEGLADLINAETASQRRLAQFHLAGGASGCFEQWRAEIVGVLARLEAAIDFSDEEGLEASALADLGRRLDALSRTLSNELEHGAAERVLDSYRVVIAGPANVGKSSLLNAIARREAAIVSAQPGTTRDVIEVQLEIDGMAVSLADTAGLREGAADEAEAEGMARSRARMGAADLVLWLSSPDVGDVPPPKEIDSETLWILNKTDLAGPAADTAGFDLGISARTGMGIDALLRAVAERARRYGDAGGSALLARERHRTAVRECRDSLQVALVRLEGPLELATEEVRSAAAALGRLTGRIEVEAILDEIFSAFCIGK